MRKEFTAEKRNKWGRTALLGTLGGAVIVLAACGSGSRKKEAENKKAIVDDYAQLMMLQDQDSAVYDQVLEEIGEYLEEPTTEKQEQVLDLLENTIQEMEALTDSYTPYQIDAEFARLLKENGISAVEYEVNANGRYEMLAMYVQDMIFLNFYVENADYDEVAMNELETAWNGYLENQKDMRGYYYTGVNYWFSGWESEDVEYVKEQVLEQFQSFSAENPVWETDRDAVEVRMNTYLNRMEERLDQSAEELGRRQEQLYELEEEVRKKEAEDRKTIVNDYAQLMMLQDQDSAVYDQVLEEIGEYLEEPTTEKQEQVLDLLENTIQEMEALTDSYTPYQTDVEFAKLLKENGISAAEYEMNANGRYEMLAMYVQNMIFLNSYVENADYNAVAMDELETAWKGYLENQKDMRGYNYTGVNYWFSRWETEDVEYVKKQVLEQFQSFSAENPVWETDRDAVEVRMNTYLNRMEERLDQSAEELGRK